MSASERTTPQTDAWEELRVPQQIQVYKWPIFAYKNSYIGSFVGIFFASEIFFQPLFHENSRVSTYKIGKNSVFVGNWQNI